MKLVKYPETEAEYWETIESIGGLAWRIEHELSDGRIKSTSGIENDLKEFQEILEKLVSELSSFGVIPPKECPQVKFGEEKPKAPEGKIWYWDWYHKMKTEFNRREFEKIICSVCPLCGGFEEFNDGNTIPCKVWSGLLYELHRPYRCVMLDRGHIWTQEKLFAEIEKVGGKKAVDKFKKKEAELRMTK